MSEVYSDLHLNQISAILVDSPNMRLLTASSDMSVSLHSMGKDKLIEDTLMKISIERDCKKINDVVMGKEGAAKQFYLGSIDGQVLGYSIKH